MLGRDRSGECPGDMRHGRGVEGAWKSTAVRQRENLDLTGPSRWFGSPT